MRYKLTSLLLALTVALGCNVQWVPVDPLVPDPSPPQYVDRVVSLLIVEETADRPRLPPGQQAIFTSSKLRTFLDTKCDAYRIVDKDDTASLPEALRSVASLDRQSTPWLYVSDGTKGLSCPLPESVDALIARLKPFVEGE